MPEGRRPFLIVTSSEAVSAEARALIEERFGCKLFDWYGQFERVAAIGTCEQGSLHVIEDYGCVEFHPAAAGLHEIVGTGFNNRVMPLVRYRTGDFVELDDTGADCPCGREFRVVRRIVGRDDDAIKLPGGRVIGRIAHMFDDVDGLLDAQIRQDAIDEIQVRVVPASTLSDAMRRRIERSLRRRLGDAIAIRIESVDGIERDRNGKYRRVVCNV
jgi:phenylacetate-CoA ligase